MQEQTLGAISRCPAGNLQDSYLFTSLTTWKDIKRRSWTNLTMPAEIINLINGRASRDGNEMDVNVEMRIRGYPIDEVINDQDHNVEVPEERVDPGPIIHDDRDGVQVVDMEIECHNIEDVPDPVLDVHVQDEE